MKVARVIGAAGSGKTTELLRLMEGALPEVGGDPHAVGLMSFTKAARQEAADRVSSAWNVPVESMTRDGWIRTGHSICYRQLGIEKGQLITDRKEDMQWLADLFKVRLQTALDDESGNQVYIGDERVSWSLNAWQYHRVTLQPLDQVVKRLRELTGEGQSVSEVQAVAERYESEKRCDGRCDYTDMLLRFAGFSCSPKYGIGRVRPEGELPPVKVWLFDEQQDASPLLDAVCKRLASGPDVKWCYAVGDPFQSVFGFAGSSAACFLGWDVVKERIMPKSYRCPAAILGLGEECLRKMNEHGGYFDRKVAPADHDGEVLRHSDVEYLSNAVSADDDWLFIARTNYQCQRLFAYLHSIGIPARSAKSQAEPTARQVGLGALWKLEKGKPITGAEWARAVEILPSRSKTAEMLVRGTKKRWKENDEAARWDIVFADDLPSIGGTEHLAGMIRSGDWAGLVDHGAKWRKTAEKWGIERALRPRARVGTIHAVKGMEADNVAILTTTSRKVEDGAREPEQWNEECRIAYVAATRARKAVHIIEEGGRNTPKMEALS